MGFHVCEYCGDETSSEYVILDYGNENVFQVPDMILHYIADHQYKPPKEFINIVTCYDLLNGRREVSKSMVSKIGYLSGPFPTGFLPPNFFESLWSDIRKATKMYQRSQTRGM